MDKGIQHGIVTIIHFHSTKSSKESKISNLVRILIRIHKSFFLYLRNAWNIMLHIQILFMRLFKIWQYQTIPFFPLYGAIYQHVKSCFLVIDHWSHSLRYFIWDTSSVKPINWNIQDLFNQSWFYWGLLF